MKRKQLIIGSVILIILGIILIFFFTTKKKEESHDDSKLIEAAQKYFEETLNKEVYVETLIENGYLDSSNERNILIKEDGDRILKEKGDSKKAEEESKKPIIIITNSNDFNINEWNKSGTKITVSLKNDGNSYYKKEDITNVAWVDESTGKQFFSDTIEISDSQINKSYLVYIEFKDGDLILEKRITIKVDNEPPKIVLNNFSKTGRIAIYEDESDNIKVFATISEKNEEPDKESMLEESDFTFDCDKKYYAWSYAVDEIGNESEITFLGEYKTKCNTVKAPSGSASNENTPEYSKPED